MTTTLNRNGLGRKSLGDQIDRLDQILTGLADALNDSVGQAVKDAVASAVQVTLAEALNSPELRERLAAGRGTAGPSALHRLLIRVRHVARKVATASRTFGMTAASIAGRVARSANTAARTWLAAVWRLRRPVLLALGVGGAVGLACFYSGPLVASIVSGFASGAELLTARARRLGATPPPAARGTVNGRAPGLPAGGFRGRYQPGQVM
jgi:hypothetical protein